MVALAALALIVVGGVSVEAWLAPFALTATVFLSALAAYLHGGALSAVQRRCTPKTAPVYWRLTLSYAVLIPAIPLASLAAFSPLLGALGFAVGALAFANATDAASFFLAGKTQGYGLRAGIAILVAGTAASALATGNLALSATVAALAVFVLDFLFLYARVLSHATHATIQPSFGYRTLIGISFALLALLAAYAGGAAAGLIATDALARHVAAVLAVGASLAFYASLHRFAEKVS